MAPTLLWFPIAVPTIMQVLSLNHAPKSGSNLFFRKQGLISGLVGSCGNLGGIIFALVFRFQAEAGKGFWITGVICIVINVLLSAVRVPEL